jgi:hypothetical protein
MSNRKFRAPIGLNIPTVVATGPGGESIQLAAGGEVDLTAAQANTRFVRNRIRAGDLVEVTPPAAARARKE